MGVRSLGGGGGVRWGSGQGGCVKKIEVIVKMEKKLGVPDREGSGREGQVGGGGGGGGGGVCVNMFK